MNYITLKSLLASAHDCQTLEQFIEEEGGAYPDQNAFDDGTLEQRLALIWTVRNGVTMKEIIEMYGGAAEFSRRFGIAYNTANGWSTSSSANSRSAPEYVTLLFLSDYLSDDGNF